MCYLNKYRYAIFLLCIMPLTVSADWHLDKQASAITYLSNKMLAGSLSSIYEKNRFTDIDGQIESDGRASLHVNVKSLDTNIPIRDERVAEYVFKASEYPQATVSLDVGKELAELNNVSPGHVQTREMRADLTMVGVTRSVDGKITLTRLTEDRLLVQTAEPILVDALAYGMGEGFAALKEIAKLFNIPTTIPVNLTLVFVRGA